MSNTEEDEENVTSLEDLDRRVNNLEEQRIGRLDEFEEIMDEFERRVGLCENNITDIVGEFEERLQALEEIIIYSNTINRIQPSLDTHTDRITSLETRLTELEQILDSSPRQSQRWLQGFEI